MAGPEILRKIVVKISGDKRNLRGTGFFVSEREILTCHHVLADGNGWLSKAYFIKNDDWDDWIEAQPIEARCSAAQDFAFLRSPVPVGLEAKRVPFKRWDGRHKEFFTRGYDCNTSEEGGASSLEGEDCRIVDESSRGKGRRWQLSTIKKSLLPGRSGSPVWSIGQRAIVGMIDYQAGDESIVKERSLAIPMEEIFPDLPPEKGQPINAPCLPSDFLPRPDDLIHLKELVLSPGENKSAITGKTVKYGLQSNTNFGLSGMGGIGKSVLAAALAWDDQVLQAFSDGIIWISLGQNPDLASRQLQVLRFLNEDHRPLTDVKDGLGCLRQILSDLSCLLILDDVWSMDDVRAFDALGPECRLLITTRNHKIARELNARELDLDILGVKESLKLLALSSGLKFDDLDPKAGEVAEECGRLPLALAMVGLMAKAALTRGRSDPWKHILNRLRSADLGKIKAEFPGYPYPNLLRAIEVSVESLEPEERIHYLDLAVFPENTEVPEAVLQLVWNLDKDNTQDMVDLLADLSLARFNSGRLGMHDLQHDFVVKRVRDLPELHKRLLDSYRKECPCWPACQDDGYFYQHLAYHLLHSGQKAELKELLLDIRWLEARLEKTDITSLISDYDLVPEDEELIQCRDGLRMSSHVLFRDSSQLAAQLLGRMQHICSPAIKNLMQQVRLTGGRPSLRPMTSSLTSPGEIRTLAGHEGWIRAIVLTPDGSRAVSASEDGTLKIWDMENGQEEMTLEGHEGLVRAVALTSDGSRAVSASDDRTLKIWDMENGQEEMTLKGHEGRINSVVLTPDNRRVISASDDKTLKIWDMENGQEEMTLKGHEEMVRAVALTSDGSRAISASEDGTLKIWDMENGQEEMTLKGHEGRINSVVLTPDNRRAISASDDKTLKIWDMENGQEEMTLKGHKDMVRIVATTPYGRRTISASDNGTLMIWDIERGLKMLELKAHGSWINAVTLDPEGRRSISVSEDRTLKVWDIDSGKVICSFTGDSSMLCCAVSPDGRTIVAGEASGRVHFLRLEGLLEGKDNKNQDTSEHADYSIALKRSNDKDDAVLSDAEMREHLSNSD